MRTFSFSFWCNYNRMWSWAKAGLAMFSEISNNVVTTPERKPLMLPTVTVGISDLIGSKSAFSGCSSTKSRKREILRPGYASGKL